MPADDGCIGPSRIEEREFHTCEELCVLTNPVDIRGMDATLYDVDCRGDWGGYEQRMLFMRRGTSTGVEQAMSLDLRFGYRELERCDGQ